MVDTDWASELKQFAEIGPRKSLAEEAADSLREFILLGKLPPGQPVPERDLAEAFGISRTPLKEALRILEKEGLIVYGPTRRPRVADPSLEELAQNLTVLGALEALAGKLACAQATDAEIERATSLEERMRTASEDTDPLEFFRWDMDFHRTIVNAARNAPLVETHQTYNARLWRARFISSKKRTAREGTLGQHNDIVTALQKRDAQACGQHMQRHLEATITNIAATQASLQVKESA
ncbi:MAG: GntR family transcriptional regulator [Pseudomonadota bacterium]